MTILALSSGIGLVGFVCICAIAAIAMGFGATRTIVVEAQTTGLQITFSGQANDWALGEVVVCTPRIKIDPSLGRGPGQCDARRYIEAKDDNFRINWDRNATTIISAITPGTLVLDISGQSEMVDRTRVLLDRQSWESVGALTFTGTARIGFQLASGESKMLLSGSFEVREKPFWSDSTEVLKSGLLRRGESAVVLVERGGKDNMAEVFGHITPSLAERSGVTVGIVSTPGPVRLQIGFFGSTIPTQIAPSWIDRALTSPLILAIAALLSILLSALQVFGNVGTVLVGSAGLGRKEVSDDTLLLLDADPHSPIASLIATQVEIEPASRP